MTIITLSEVELLYAVCSVAVATIVYLLRLETIPRSFVEPPTIWKIRPRKRSSNES